MLFFSVPRAKALSGRACVSPRVRVPACVSPRVPACAPRLHAGAACVALQRAGCAACAGERGGPGPTCGAGGADTPDATTPSQSRAGGFLSGIPGGNRRRKVSAEAIHSRRQG